MRKNLVSSKVLCISIAQKPGMFGTIIHNAGFKALKLNFMYKAFAINDLEGAITGVRALGIKGCSVSMPFKEDVIQHLDSLHPLARRAKAVNTIVNEKGRLIGYNTDILGVEECLKKFRNKKEQRIVIFGAGGMARAVLVALENLKLRNIELVNRTTKNGKKLSKEFDVKFLPWSSKENITTDIIINTTSLGMYPNIQQCPISNKVIKNSKIVMDVISNPSETKLVQLAKNNKKIVINGTHLAFYQALAQFRLYTGKNPPVKKMQNAIKNFWK
tara:strand:- start:1058 stop:1876 length:819 start_codon:yes stop_codon:yes gene_type:complete